MQTVLITGASGFCASHLARALAAEGGLRLIGSDLTPEPPAGSTLDDYLAADIGRPADVATLVRRVRPEMVFHLAGLTRGTSDELYRTNLLGGVRLLESVREVVPGARVLVVGSAAEYGPAPTTDMPLSESHECRPAGAYGLSKHALCLAAQDFARNRGLKVVVARPFNVVGAGTPPSLVVGAVIQRAKEALAGDGQPVIAIGNLDGQRDFVAVEDVMDGYLRLIRGEHWGEAFNLCSGVPRAVRDVVEILLSHATRPLRYETDPRLLHPSDAPLIYGSWEKARRAFGFAPKVRIEDALRSAWQHVMREDD